MKPVAQGCTAMAQDGKCAPLVWFGAYPKDGENVYTDSEIRKWLLEAPEFFNEYHKELYFVLIAAKLEELK